MIRDLNYKTTQVIAKVGFHLLELPIYLNFAPKKQHENTISASEKHLN